MTDTLTRPELLALVEQLRELEAKATRGPWVARASGHGPHALRGPSTFDNIGHAAPDDGRLIAALRNALPALLDALTSERAVKAESLLAATERWCSLDRGSCDSVLTHVRAEARSLRHDADSLPSPDAARASAAAHDALAALGYIALGGGR